MKPKLHLLTPPSEARTIQPPPTILEPTEDGDIDTLARLIGDIAIRIATERADASRDLPASEHNATGDQRRVA